MYTKHHIFIASKGDNAVLDVIPLSEVSGIEPMDLPRSSARYLAEWSQSSRYLAAAALLLALAFSSVKTLWQIKSFWTGGHLLGKPSVSAS